MKSMQLLLATAVAIGSGVGLARADGETIAVFTKNQTNPFFQNVRVGAENAAKQLGAKGFRMLVHGRSRERGESLVREIEAAGGKATFLHADLASLAEVRKLADAALKRLSKHYPNVPTASVDQPPKGIHYAINATPLGLKTGDPLSFDPMQLDHDVVVAEVIMSPVETPLLQRARTHGRRIHHGRHMLDHQVPLYLEWFGIDAKSVDVVALARSIV